MARRIDTPVALAVCLLALVVAATGAWATDSPEPAADTTLEAELRARRPDILRWETRPVERSRHAAQTHAPAIVAVGRLGVRTPVRFADGRVRWYAVAGFRPVPVSAHAVEVGASLTAADALIAERDVIGPACEPVSIDDGSRWRATRRLATGEALCANAVARAPDVERDQRVTLSTERGAIRVTRVLVAAGDARTGERVRLRDPATAQTVTAIVTGAATARVLQE
jgi:flagella basal body P-ring formation protein FlgA